MTPQQRKFSKAARRCRGDAACMSKALSGGYGLLPRKSVAGTKCVKWSRTKPRRCKKWSFRHKGKKGVWKGLYAKKGYYWTRGTMPTHGKKCKGYTAKGRGCKVRCASYNRKAGYKTRAAAKSACRRKRR